jgi:hypothetical protein
MLLQKQIPPAKQLEIIVFQAIKIQYAISALDGFVHVEWKRKIDAFLSRAIRSGLCRPNDFLLLNKLCFSLFAIATTVYLLSFHRSNLNIIAGETEAMT